ncbi:MAG: SurA N-terminal domain-containing protein [Deltaproteobacteria bacterium]|nr:SurA N-terminal domain-containing protein [Deltaproteobacteria bacterium]
MNIRNILLLFLSLLIVQVSSVQANIIDSCVAVVNDDVITLSEVNEAGKPMFQRVAEQVPPEQLADALKQARQTVIEKLIEKRLLVQQAEQMQISVSDEDVDRALAQILERNSTTMEQFKSELARMGVDEQQYRDNLRDQLLGSKLINYEVRSKVIVPEEKIIDYYDQHYTEQVGAGGYYILQIGVTLDKEGMPADPVEAKEVAKKKAERILSLATGGQDFKQLARQYSDLPSAVDGGDIGAFQKDEMAEYMRDAVTSLKPGEISPVVESPNGYMLFKLLSSQEGKIITKVPYDSVKEEIRNTLYQQEMEKRYDTWLEEIRSQAYIKIL